MSKVVGERIKERRRQLDINQTALAKRLGITQSALSKIERGAVSLSMQLVQKISVELEIPTTALLHEAEQHQRQQEDFFGDDTISDLVQMLESGQYSEMLRVIRKVEGARYFESPENKAELHRLQAFALARRGELDKAEKICRNILIKYKPFMQRKPLAEVYNVLGLIHFYADNQQLAVESFETAHKLLRDKHGDSKVNIMAMIHLALSLTMIEEEERAMDILGKVSELIFTRLDFFIQYDANIKLVAGEIEHNIHQNHELGTKFLQYALNDYWTVGDVRGQFRICTRLRRWYLQSGHVEKAMEYEEHFQKLAKKYPEEARNFLQHNGI